MADALGSVRRQAVIRCAADTAFGLWTQQLGTWWPLEAFSCFGAKSSVEVNDGSFVETGPAGETAVWGSITESESGCRCSFTWHPGSDARSASTVSLEFTAVPGHEATVLTLEHSRWKDAGQRERYRSRWAQVLDSFVTQAERGAGAAEPGEIWMVLEHRAGPAAPEAGVYSSPDFPKHLQFLRSLLERGTLVAAGPLPDTPGGGMAIVRLPDIGAAQQLVRAAQFDDGSVAAQLLTVRVRPWQVLMHP